MHKMNNIHLAITVLLIIIVITLIIMLVNMGNQNNNQVVTIAPSNGIITLNAQRGRVIFQLNKPLNNSTGNISYNLNVNAARNQQIGDVVIMQFGVTNPTSGNEALLNLPTNVYMTGCGDVLTSLDIGAWATSNIVLTYDGVNFVNTYDNC
jgi:hypothetical protein